MSTTYAEVLEDIQAIGTEAFDSAWRDAGRALSGHLPETLMNEGTRICVISSAQDYDHVAKGFSEALKDAKVQVSRYCLWNKFKPRQGDLPSSNALLGQHSDEHPAHVQAIIAVSSTTVESAALADNLSRVAARFPTAERYLACLASSSESEDALGMHFADRDLPPPVLVRIPRAGTTTDISISAAELRDRLLAHLHKIYGRVGLGYVPKSLGGPEPRYTPSGNERGFGR